MKTITGATLVAALVLNAAAPAASSPVFRRAELGTGAFSKTLTQAMLPSHAVDLGAVPASLPLKIVVGLTPNKAAAERALRAMYTPGTATYHKFMTPAQYTASFAPSGAAVGAVATYLKSMGFTNIASTPNNLLVRAQGTAAMASAAFNTTLHAFNQNGKAIYVNVTPAMVPTALSGVVSSVLGLQSVPMQLALRAPKHRHAHRPISRMHKDAAGRNHLDFAGCEVPSEVGPCAVSNFYAAELRYFYDDNGAPTGSNTNIAIFTEGDVSDIVPDLHMEEGYNGFAQFPVNMVPVDLQSTDTYGQAEFTMDTQMSTGIAGGVKSLTLYNVGSLGDEDLTLDFNRWVTDDTATTASASLGECEYQAELDGAMPLDDYIFQEAALQGQSMFASAGDSGSSCGFNVVTNGVPAAGPPQVEYPASSPYVIGAGGTTAFPNSDGSYGDEISWNSGGGGISLFEPPEFWTYTTVPTQCVPVYCSIAGPGLPVSITGGSGRAVPDVAMDADADVSGANYVLNGAWTENGGTSLASPLSVGVFTRLSSRHNNQLGLAGPVLYQEYTMNGGSFTDLQAPASGSIDAAIGGFHDVLVGTNGLYDAKPGYDFTTGMGSFDINESIVYFGS